jgi:hypothetical protein
LAGEAACPTKTAAYFSRKSPYRLEPVAAPSNLKEAG